MNPIAVPPSTVPSPDAPSWADTLIHSRRTTLPKRLCGPGPDGAQRNAILAAAAAAPDHGQLLPWRFIEVPDTQRARLAQAFADALLARDPAASADDVEQAREKAHRSPWLLLAVCRARGGVRGHPAQVEFDGVDMDPTPGTWCRCARHRTLLSEATSGA